MGQHHEVLNDLRDPTRSLRDAIPDAWSAIAALNGAAIADGAVSRALKEAAALAMSVVKRCDGCIAFHARGAARAGATPQQVSEMLAVALLLDGGSATVYAPRAWAAYQEFLTDRAGA